MVSGLGSTLRYYWVWSGGIIHSDRSPAGGMSELCFAQNREGRCPRYLDPLFEWLETERRPRIGEFRRCIIRMVFRSSRLTGIRSWSTYGVGNHHVVRNSRQCRRHREEGDTAGLVGLLDDITRVKPACEPASHGHAAARCPRLDSPTRGSEAEFVG